MPSTTRRAGASARCRSPWTSCCDRPGSVDRRRRGPEVAHPTVEARGANGRLHTPGGRFMKAVVFHGVGDIRLEDVAEPGIEQPTDAIVRLTASAIRGTDLHMIRGMMPGMLPGTIMGHEGIGVVEEVG